MPSSLLLLDAVLVAGRTITALSLFLSHAHSLSQSPRHLRLFFAIAVKRSFRSFLVSTLVRHEWLRCLNKMESEGSIEINRLVTLRLYL